VSDVVLRGLLEAASIHGRASGDGVLFVLALSSSLLAGAFKEGACRGGGEAIMTAAWFWAAEKVEVLTSPSSSLSLPLWLCNDTVALEPLPFVISEGLSVVID